MKKQHSKILVGFDWTLVFLAFLIPLCGLVVLYSAGFDPDQTKPLLEILPIAIHSQPFLKQCFFLFAGFWIMLGVSLIPPGWLQKIAYPFYFVCLGLLILVELFGVIVNGSQRWLDLGFFRLQPAEPVKLAVTIAVAKYLAKHPPALGGYTLKDLFIPACIVLLPVALILKQPDLGSALLVLSVGGCMVLFLGIRVRLVVTCLVIGLIAAYPVWEYGLHDFQKRRIQVFLDPGMDPRGSGWHINQSKIAVGSGALFGKGFREGSQTQLEFLPEHTTDFIFSVLAEEWGFVGCISVLLLYGLFLMRIIYNSQKAKDLFGAILIIGIGGKFFFHFLVNIGMVIGLLPVVGIPLALFSYGGSSVFSSMIGLGLILGQGIRRRMY